MNEFENNIILEGISTDDFLSYWESQRKSISIDTDESLVFFKPFIDLIPKTVIGDFYWQIFDNSQPEPKVILVGGSVEKLTPFSASELLSNNYKKFFDIFHPDDLKITLQFISRAYEIIKYQNPISRNKTSISIFTRIQNCDGIHQWNILQYPALLFDDEKNILLGMALYTNVNHLLQSDSKPMMTITDSSQNNSQTFTYYKTQTRVSETKLYPILSKRERQIVALLSKGYSSKQIASLLSIQKNTVDNHRQRLLKKFGVNSSTELVVKAMLM